MTEGRVPAPLRVGLLVNPVAGMGGAVGLKGTDGEATLAEARARGATPRAQARARRALEELRPLADRILLLCGPGPMGEDLAREMGFSVQPLFPLSDRPTRGEDTARGAALLEDAGTSLVLFAGGDGTARDVAGALGTRVPAVGIPAGVKIHSAVFATDPASAGRLAASFLEGKARQERELEVMDLDEEAYRQGRVSARLFGFLRVPYQRGRVQGLKSGTPASDRAQQAALAQGFLEIRDPKRLTLVGPGTTPRAVLDELGLEGTLLGVDALLEDRLLARDLNERDLLDLLDRHPRPLALVTPIGGQGFLFGRGNLQFSPAVLRRLGRRDILPVATPGKLQSLGGVLRLDTGDEEVDRMLSGPWRVLTGFREWAMVRAVL